MSELVKIETLTLHQIDHCVAKLEGVYQLRAHGDFTIEVAEDERVYFLTQSGRRFPFAPTVDWRQCGPIIEDNHITIKKVETGWLAHRAGADVATGPTALIAAMRTRVKMGYPNGVEVAEL